jgi:hypothetical protein
MGNEQSQLETFQQAGEAEDISLGQHPRRYRHRANRRERRTMTSAASHFLHEPDTHVLQPGFDDPRPLPNWGVEGNDVVGFSTSANEVFTGHGGFEDDDEDLEDEVDQALAEELDEDDFNDQDDEEVDADFDQELEAQVTCTQARILPDAREDEASDSSDDEAGPVPEASQGLKRTRDSESAESEVKRPKLDVSADAEDDSSSVSSDSSSLSDSSSVSESSTSVLRKLMSWPRVTAYTDPDHTISQNQLTAYGNAIRRYAHNVHALAVPTGIFYDILEVTKATLTNAENEVATAQDMKEVFENEFENFSERAQTRHDSMEKTLRKRIEELEKQADEDKAKIKELEGRKTKARKASKLLLKAAARMGIEQELAEAIAEKAEQDASQTGGGALVEV